MEGTLFKEDNNEFHNLTTRSKNLNDFMNDFLHNTWLDQLQNLIWTLKPTRLNVVVRPTSCEIIPDMESRPEAPPYEEAVEPDAPPPSYDTFGRVRQARRSCNGPCEFIKAVVIIILSTIGCSIFLGVTVIIPVSMIVMGSMYLNDCPQEEYIPIFLVVSGCIGVLEMLIYLCTKGATPQLQSVLSCFAFAWFFAGSIWVYRIYEPNYDFTKGAHCNRTLYLFAFWMITSVYISLGILMCCLCSLGALFALTNVTTC